jgi:hypothetical protein
MEYHKGFVVEPGAKVRLGQIDAAFKDKHESHDTAKPEIEKHVERMSKLSICCTPTATNHYWLFCRRSMPAAKTVWCATCSAA